MATVRDSCVFSMSQRLPCPPQSEGLLVWQSCEINVFTVLLLVFVLIYIYNTILYNTTSFISSIEQNNITTTICTQHWDGWKGVDRKIILSWSTPNKLFFFTNTYTYADLLFKANI